MVYWRLYMIIMDRQRIGISHNYAYNNRGRVRYTNSVSTVVLLLTTAAVKGNCLVVGLVFDGT